MEHECARDVLEYLPKIMQVLRTTMRSTANEHLTVPQFRVLVKLGKATCSNSELAEWQGTSEPAMSRMVDALVKKGLVTRESGVTDRRQVVLALTPKGKKEYTKMREKAILQFSASINALTTQEKSDLKRGLNMLRKAFL